MPLDIAADWLGISGAAMTGLAGTTAAELAAQPHSITTSVAADMAALIEDLLAEGLLVWTAESKHGLHAA